MPLSEADPLDPQRVDEGEIDEGDLVGDEYAQEPAPTPPDSEPPTPDPLPAPDPELPPPPPPPSGVFRHPGVLVNQAQLDLIRDKVKAGAEPWKSAFAKTLARAPASYEPKPRAVVSCGPYSNPNIGCSDELNDAVAAWSHALAWYVTGDVAHAQKAAQIMNAWSAVFDHHDDSNAPLQAAWSGALWPRPAEILRATYSGWTSGEHQRFVAMLKKGYLPAIINGSGANGNWELSMIDAIIAIAVYTDDKASFDKAIGMWKRLVPAYLYLKSDGTKPVAPPKGSFNWYGQTTYVDGLAQETCRDLQHTQLGLSAAINAAETAFQQGVYLYQIESTRLRAGLEFHADYLLGKPAPSWLCGGTLNDLRAMPMWEIAYNHYKNRRGIDLPLSGRFIREKVRATSGVFKHMAWETLTHAESGSTGLK